METVLIKLFLAVLLISTVTSLVGTFTFLQKKALISDALSHSVLPGIVIGFLLNGHLNAWWVLGGATFSGWLALLFFEFLRKRSTLQPDALLAIVLSAFLAIGLALLSYTQIQPEFARSGLTDFLFGKITAINWNDILMMSIVTAVSLVVIRLQWHTLVARSFDETYVKTRGFNVRSLDFVFNLLIITSVAISVQAIGVVLTSALLIVPVTCARMFTHNVLRIAVISLVIAVTASLSGTLLSVKFKDLPTGPSMVIMLSAVFVVGIIVQTLQKRSNG